jgi:hypothetical protein
VALTSEVADHLNLKGDADLYWSDSSWFSWAVPEQGICGFFYNHFRPNMNCFLGGPAMWDASGHHGWDMLYYDWQLMRLLPKGTYGVDYDKYDFETPCSMGIRTLEPLKRYNLFYDRNGFKLDLVFEAIALPNQLGVHAEGGFEDAYRLHFEQPGRITGRVELDGRRYDVDCFSIRDGSHGRRQLDNITPGGYTWSTADEKTGWHVMAVDLDKSHETKVMGGYILRDGVMSPIVSGVRRVLERVDSRPTVVEVEAEDQLGRKLRALGREKTWAELILFSCHAQYWSLFEWEYDGFTKAIGEDQEYYSLDDFRRWHRAGPEGWRKR